MENETTVSNSTGENQRNVVGLLVFDAGGSNEQREGLYVVFFEEDW